MHGSAWAVYARSGARKCGVCALATSGAELSWWVLAVIVADRENNRLQVFTLDGDHVANWPCHRACGLTTCQDGFVYVGQAGGPNPAYGAVTNIGQRVMIFDREGQEVQYIGGSGGERPDQFNVRPAKQPTSRAIPRRVH